MALLVGQRIASSFSSFQLIHRCVNVRSSAGQIHKLAEDRCRNTIGLENIQRRMFEARKCSQQARESVDLLQLKAKNSRGSLSESQIDLETERFEKKRQEEGLETAKRKAEHLKAEKEGSVVGKLHLELQEYKEILKCSIRLDRPKEYQSCYCAISCKSNCNCNLAVVLGFMSVAVLLAEATLLPSNVNLSLFSFLIKSAGKQELLVQVLAFIPLMYMCICTYYSLFKIGMLMFYSLTPGQTSSVSMLMICSWFLLTGWLLDTRHQSYNFLNLIYLDQNAKTVFEERMGNIDDVVPFFGEKFNRIYPLLMVIYTILVVSDFFDRVISYFGSWLRSRFARECNDVDGSDSAGTIILQNKRSWLQREQRVGEQVRPPAKNADSITFDVESRLNEK